MGTLELSQLLSVRFTLVLCAFLTLPCTRLGILQRSLGMSKTFDFQTPGSWRQNHTAVLSCFTILLDFCYMQVHSKPQLGYDHHYVLFVSQ